MSIKTLAELCTRNVVENFDTNGAVISIYDLGDQICADIIDRLLQANKIDDDTVDRLQVNGIETLKFIGWRTLFSNKVSCWLANIVATGLEVLTINCKDFDGTFAKAIVDKYEKKMAATTSRNSSSDIEEQQRSVVEPALRTLSVCENSSDKPTFDELIRMLSIFSGTLKSLKIVNNGGPASALEIFDATGKLCLDKLVLDRLHIGIKDTFTVTPSMQNLRTLDFYALGALSDQHVLSFLEVAGPNIQHLSVKMCFCITDSTPRHIQLHCPSLISLELSCSKTLTPAGLEQFFETASLAKLERLTLCYNNAVTDTVVAKIAAAVGTQLTYIRICGTVITKQSLPILASMPLLKYADLETCNWPDYKDLDDFMPRQGLELCDVYDNLHADD